MIVALKVLGEERAFLVVGDHRFLVVRRGQGLVAALRVFVALDLLHGLADVHGGVEADGDDEGGPDGREDHACLEERLGDDDRPGAQQQVDRHEGRAVGRHLKDALHLLNNSSHNYNQSQKYQERTHCDPK